MTSGAGSKPLGEARGGSADSPKPHGDKLGDVVGQTTAGETREGSGPAGDPKHDSPKRHGDKLETSRDAAAGKSGE